MNEIKPVTIPREVADAIEELRKGDETSEYLNSDIAYKYSDVQDRGRTASAIRKIPFDTLMRALLDGYERELTEEETRYKVVADEYSEYVYGVQQRESEAEDYAYADGIVFTLNALGIKIMGVNTAFISEGGAA